MATTKKDSRKKNKPKKYFTEGQVISNLLSSGEMKDRALFDDFEAQDVVKAFRSIEEEQYKKEDEITFGDLFSYIEHQSF